MAGISVIVLTFNSAATIGRTLKPLMEISDDIHIVDSYSKDDTVAVCEALGCQVTQHPFTNYAAQRNWAIDTLALKHDWQLHVDADEELTPELTRAIKGLNLATVDTDGFIIGRKIVFMDLVLRFGGIARTWHYRLFRNGFGRCEERLYDQHFVAAGRTRQIREYMLDYQDTTIAEWTARHNRWSDMEAEEAFLGSVAEAKEGQVQASLGGNIIARKRYAQGWYYRLPLFLRPTIYLFYRYFILLGFLDGRRGFIYHMLQAFWFRLLVDTKIYERQLAAKAGG
ncbi:glycosyltransferase family 2 protein [Sphingomonas naphthae]|uniref:Glycosyltransferase family 2 protein n=1 Tax=Sphingomonas naphthae TaxID=1813468 RepID=A0ABY7TK99_9SPHN|nr:glycosyltransferase family 2 protein [Sphingomonas naphthae]WCT73625.1 glycosyltransferase family 2 protein [Sphingomonas naphthae]